MENKEKKEVVKIINEELLGFNFSLIDYLDHTSILSWIQYMAHRCAINKPNKNFDGRDFIMLPSGRKIVITINIKEYEK